VSALLAVHCQSAAAANSYQAEAETGTLNGVDLGTTTDTGTADKTFVVRCTLTRAKKLVSTFEEATYFADEAPTPATLEPGCAVYYVLGQLDSQ